MERTFRFALVVAGVAALSAAGFGQPYNTNLLVNPGAEMLDMTGWTVTDNSGGDASCAPGPNGFTVVGADLPCATWNFCCGYSGNYAFATSYVWDARYQDVDLVAQGFTPDQLDAAPEVQFSEWVRSRGDSGCSYAVRFELLDGSSNTIAFFEHGNSGAPIELPPATDWFQEAYSFTGYGPGLRFLRISDGGVSTNFWAGWYGAHFDDASALLVGTQPPVCRGDCNCDGQIDFADINPFVAVLAGGTPCRFENCDINGDNQIDFADINPFVTLLAGGAHCP